MITADSIFIALDTETTGLSATDGRIVEIAAIKFDLSGNELGRFERLVNPLIPIPPRAIAVHHITDDMVAGEPDITEILPLFLEFVAGDNSILIAQNAIFDIGFVNHEGLRNDIKLPRHTILDQIELTRKIFPDLPTYSLEKVCRRFDLVDSQTHRALGDSILVKKLFSHCLSQVENEDQRLALLNGMPHYSFGGPMIVELKDGLLDCINNAIEKGQLLEINYRGGSNKGRARQILPILAFNRDGVYYLNAKCMISGTNKQFRVDRIETWQPVANHS